MGVSNAEPSQGEYFHFIHFISFYSSVYYMEYVGRDIFEQGRFALRASCFLQALSSLFLPSLQGNEMRGIDIVTPLSLLS